MKKLVRFGILIDSYYLEKWQAECLDSLRKLDGIILDLVIINSNQNKDHKEWWRRIRFNIFIFQLVYLYIKNKSILRKIDYSPILKDVSKIICETTIKGKNYQYFTEQDSNLIKSRQLDFILCFSFGKIHGGIINSAKYGVWSFRHCDENKYRGEPSCFWEIFFSNPVTGAILQRLTDEYDVGSIIYKGYFKTIKHSFKKSINNVYLASSEWPAFIACQIQDELVDEKSWEISVSKTKYLNYPNNWQTFYFILVLFKNNLMRIYSAIFKHESWSIGIVEEPIQNILKGIYPQKIYWVKSSNRERFYSDPFGILNNNKLLILFEDYNYSSKRGVISSIQMTDNNDFSEPTRIISKSFHLSYPYIVETDEGIYCIPEAHESKKISLYKAVEMQNRWEYECDLITGHSLVDPTIFYWNKKWWLFCTDFNRGSNQCLVIYYASDIRGTWYPHKKNPVKMDIRSSQSAGTPFIDNGYLYRPSQNCSISYGSSICINKIIKLNEIEFEEIVEKEVKPFWKNKRTCGIHTISSCGNYTIIDAKEEKFILSALFNKLVNIFKH